MATHQTEIAIEPIGWQHRAAVQELAADPAIGATSEVPSPYPPGGADTWIRETIQRRGEGTEHSFAILVSSRFVGVAALVRCGKGAGELGYWVGRPFWARGYATAGSELVVHFGFEELGLALITSSCLVTNTASRRVLERLGFRFSHEGPTTSGTKWKPSGIFAYWELSRDAWLSRPRSRE